MAGTPFARAGARICLGARADAEFDFTPLEDGEMLELGDVRLRVLETPGHTPESISVVVYDSARSMDILMASVGVSSQTLGDMLYDSLHDKLLRLPDGTLLYPGHGAGSMCGEWRQGALPGAINIPLEQMRARVAGERSSTAASLLEHAGRRDVVDLGGITAWQASRTKGASAHV